MKKLEREIRYLLWFFVIAFFLSGITAIPVATELSFVSKIFPVNSEIGVFLATVQEAITKLSLHYPFLFYGYDWLAFAHFVLAILFIGALNNPIKNKWVIEFGMIACFLVIPYALVAGYFRGIPIWWRLLDCSFGFFGFIPLLVCYKKINILESLNDSQESFKNE